MKLNVWVVEGRDRKRFTSPYSVTPPRKEAQCGSVHMRDMANSSSNAVDTEITMSMWPVPFLSLPQSSTHLFVSLTAASGSLSPWDPERP